MSLGSSWPSFKATEQAWAWVQEAAPFEGWRNSEKVAGLDLRRVGASGFHESSFYQRQSLCDPMFCGTKVGRWPGSDCRVHSAVAGPASEKPGSQILYAVVSISGRLWPAIFVGGACLQPYSETTPTPI